MSDYAVYVLDKDGNPLMPTKRFGKVRRMLKAGKAKAVCNKPFTIQLQYEPETHIVQEVVLGIDPGRTNIGVSCTREDGTCLFSAEAVTRNKEIPRLMEKRRQCRQASRRGERLARKRLAKKYDTVSTKNLDRKLPGYDEVVHVKDIINTEAQFNNRKRDVGWLTPTATQLLRTHINLIRKICKFLPISHVSIEVNKFSFMKLDNPHIKPWEYAKGPMHGFKSIKEALDIIQGRRCLLCGKPIECRHHLTPRSKGGMDTLENMAGLCGDCHEVVHKDADMKVALDSKKSGCRKRYAGISVLNQITPRLLQELDSMFHGNVTLTDGYATREFREKHGIEKTHASDAYCISCATLTMQDMYDVPEDYYTIRQYRRHDRAKIKAQTSRVYKLNNRKVAVNRHKAMEQKEDSLEEWYDSAVEKYGRQEADAMRSHLYAVKSMRKYNNLDRIMPGAVFLYNGKRYVLRGQLTGGKYYRAEGMDDTNFNFSAKDCTVICKNTGLVFA